MSDDTSATQTAAGRPKLRVGLGEVLAVAAAVLLVVSSFLASYSGHLLGRTYNYTGWHSLFVAELVAVELLGAVVGVVAALAGVGALPRSLPWAAGAAGAAVAVLVGAVVSPIGYQEFLSQARVPGTIGIGAGPYLAIGGAVVLLAGCVLVSVPAINVALTGRSPERAALPAGGGYEQAPGYPQGGYPAPGGGYYGQPAPGPQAGGYGPAASNPWSAPPQAASRAPSPWAPQAPEAGPPAAHRAERPTGAPVEPTAEGPAWQAQPAQPQSQLAGSSSGPTADQPAQQQPAQHQPTQPAWQQPAQPQAAQPAWGEPSPWSLGGTASTEPQPVGPAGGTPRQTATGPTGQPAAAPFSPFWAAVPTPRTVFRPDDRTSPVGVVQPGAWYAVVAQQPGGGLVVQLPDGSHGVLVDTADLIRA